MKTIMLNFEKEQIDLQEKIKQLKEQIINEFLSILEKRYSKIGVSKHHTLGPIGKLLNKLRNTSDFNMIRGYIFRVIEQDEDFKGIGQKLISDLDSAISNLEKLKQLLTSDVEWFKILQSIDYTTYFLETKRNVSRVDEIMKKDWIDFATEKGITYEALKSTLPTLSVNSLEEINPYDMPYEFKNKYGDQFTKWRNEKKKLKVNEN